MKIEYENERYIRNCIKTCEDKKHVQQVVFSTFHNCLTQICFTCNSCRTSLSFLDRNKIKNNQSLKSFEVEETK
jgi:hypothetical protein